MGKLLKAAIAWITVKKLTALAGTAVAAGMTIKRLRQASAR